MKKILGAGAGQKWTGSATLIASCAAVIMLLMHLLAVQMVLLLLTYEFFTLTSIISLEVSKKSLDNPESKS